VVKKARGIEGLREAWEKKLQKFFRSWKPGGWQIRGVGFKLPPKE
jgi:hypothetical protein